jgi:leader peptidase (prepilin peptidase)/N-methyltransferase
MSRLVDTTMPASRRSIARQLPFVGALMIVTGFAFATGPGLATAVWLALVTPALVVFDVQYRRLPNALVLPGAVTLLIDLGWSWAVRGAFPMASIVAVALSLVLLLIMNALGGLGMGDVKLALVQCGCLSVVSPAHAAAAMVLAFVLGGIVSAVLLIRGSARGSRIPFGPFLLSGFWLAVLMLIA